jgi:hypothetical protein
MHKNQSGINSFRSPRCGSTVAGTWSTLLADGYWLGSDRAGSSFCGEGAAVHRNPTMELNGLFDGRAGNAVDPVRGQGFAWSAGPTAGFLAPANLEGSVARFSAAG